MPCVREAVSASGFAGGVQFSPSETVPGDVAPARNPPPLPLSRTAAVPDAPPPPPDTHAPKPRHPPKTLPPPGPCLLSAKPVQSGAGAGARAHAPPPPMNGRRARGCAGQLGPCGWHGGPCPESLAIPPPPPPAFVCAAAAPPATIAAEVAQANASAPNLDVALSRLELAAAAATNASAAAPATPADVVAALGYHISAFSINGPTQWLRTVSAVAVCGGDGAWAGQYSNGCAPEEEEEGGVPPPPPDQSDHRGKTRNLPGGGGAGWAICGTQPPPPSNRTK